MENAMILWRRLDSPGHDACRLWQTAGRWRLQGCAAFAHATGAAALSYSVTCDKAWRTVAARVDGFVGERTIRFAIERDQQDWMLNGAHQPGLSQLADLDLAFTPATNLIPLRRAAIEIGQRVELPAAWLDVDTGTLSALSQSYERRSDEEYWYRAPSTGYEGLLQVTPTGFIRHYPGLWRQEPA